MTTSTSCLHVVAASTTLCERCNKIVAPNALHAARLRHMHGDAESLPTFVEQGVSTHTIVRGDVVGEVVICVRPRRGLDRPGSLEPDGIRRYPDPDHLRTDLVAEITTGCDAVGLPTGLVVEVKVQGVVVADKASA